MVEAYWHALARDIAFSHYEDSPIIAQAVKDLSRLSAFRGVTAKTIFRGPTSADLSGPYISQFLWKDLPYGTTLQKQRYRTIVPETDYLTNYEEWLGIQRGGNPVKPAVWDLTPRYIRNGRDLSM